MSRLDTAPDDRVGPLPTAHGGLALASRGDALTPYLFDAIERRYPVIGRVDPELTRRQRYQVAATTFRLDRADWAERFYKSGTARRMRSGNAARRLRRLPAAPAAVLQVHQLFDLAAVPTLLYVDCTHRQSAEQWPAWNPLRGRALDEWYRREHESYTAAEHVFAFSEPTRDSLVLDYGVAPERITVTGAGVNAHGLPAVAPRPVGGPPTILFVGNDFVRKGGDVLLEAFRQVRRVLPDARLRLVGTTPPIEAQPGVEVLGRVRDRARIAELYRQASVFALPSLFDPFPLVLLEAMAFGVPTVATRQTGVPEMAVDGDSASLVAPGDVDALAAALLAVLQDEDLAARLRTGGRARVEERFTWDAVVDRMAPALDAALGERRG